MSSSKSDREAARLILEYVIVSLNVPSQMWGLDVWGRLWRYFDETPDWKITELLLYTRVILAGGDPMNVQRDSIAEKLKGHA